MNKQETMEQIMAGMTAFTKTEFLRAELLPEYLKLQQELVNLTFNEEHADRGELRTWDVYAHLEKMNEDRGHVADESLQKFKVDCDNLTNLIRTEISGSRGERMAFRCLEGVRNPNHIVTNAELSFDGLRTEVDAVVVTSKGLFLVEVKNTQKDILIDEIGNYYRLSEQTILDSNIGEKMNLKECFLRKAVEGAKVIDSKQLNIIKLVVFTNSRVSVENQFKYIQTCHLSQLQYLIDDYEGIELYSADEMRLIAGAIEAAGKKEYYAADMDICSLKKDFARVLVDLESPSKENQRTESKQDIMENMDVVKEVCNGEFVDNSHDKITAILCAATLVIGLVAGLALGKRS